MLTITFRSTDSQNANATSSPEPPRRSSTIAWTISYLLLSAWALRWLWGGDVAPGIDVGGHLTRLDAAWELFRTGHLDGWFDQVSVGYQIHLLYGPGFAFIVAIFKLLSLGMLSTAGAYKMVGTLATVAIPFSGMALARAIGLPPKAAWLTGALMMAVSSPMSSGIEGAFLMGLMPQQVAAPMVLGAWALTIGPRRHPVLLGTLVALLTVTHPYSLVMYISFGVLVLVVARIQGNKIPWLSRIHAAIIALVLTAWWWIPAIAGRTLRGLNTGWANPPFLEHLRLVAIGERGVAYPVSAMLVVGLLGLAIFGLYRKNIQLVSLVALPLVAMAGLHIFVYLVKDYMHEAILFPNRGLTFAAYLAMPAVAVVLASLTRTGVIIGLSGTILAVSHLAPPTIWYNQPNQAIEAMAVDLAQEVPPGYRFAYAELPMEASGVAAPSRYLGWLSGVPDFTIFGSEWAPGSGISGLVYNKLDRGTVEDWLSQLRRYRVSHVISTTPEISELFGRQSTLKQVSVHDNLELWAMAVPNEQKVLDAGPNFFVLELGGAAARGEEVQLPFGYSPGWHADGYQLGRNHNDLLTIQANPKHEPAETKPDQAETILVNLEWRLPKVHTIGWLVTLAGLAGLAIHWVRPSQVVERQTRRYPNE